MGDKRERRVVPAEVRVELGDGEKRRPRIEGYAAVFDQESVDLGGFREVIHRGTFADSVVEDDIRGLVNHNADLVLGRNRAGTLELREDDHGLAFVLYPPNTAAARDLLVSMERGDVDQMSFGFEAVRDRWETDERGALRHLLEARLFDVSVVTFPAYPQTSAEAREESRQWSVSSGQRAAGEPGDPEDGEPGGQPGGEDPRGRNRRNRARLEIASRV